MQSIEERAENHVRFAKLLAIMFGKEKESKTRKGAAQQKKGRRSKKAFLIGGNQMTAQRSRRR